MEKTLSYSEMKKIVRDIYEEEKREHNLDLNINSITLIEYFNKGIFKENLKLTKNPVYSAALPIIAGGYSKNNEDTIVIFFIEYQKNTKNREENTYFS